MEGLPKDLRHYLARRFLVLGSLRNLLCVSKSYYMMFKFYVKVQTVPFGGSYTPTPCISCKSNQEVPPWNWQGGAWIADSNKAKLPKRALDYLVPKNGLIECDQGHRYLCHSKDTAGGSCPKCKTMLKKIKF
jgi:hypothetical protein